MRIVKGIDNHIQFIVKKPGTLDVYPIEPSDQFTFHFKRIDNDSIDITKTVTGISSDTGTVPLSLTAQETSKLVKEVGPKADYQYSKPTYKLAVTVSSSIKFTVVVPEVFIE